MKNLMFMAVLAAVAANGAEFHVDARAVAGGDGSAANPWRTVGEAVAGVRAARASGVVKAGEPVAIEFQSGDYYVDGGIRLTAVDSGTAQGPVVWRTRGNARARITGGVQVPAEWFRKVEDPAVLARLPEAARGRVYVADVSGLVPAKLPTMANAFGGTPTAPMLFTGGRHGTLARWPNSEYTSFTKAVDKGGTLKQRPDGGKVCSPGAFIYDNPRAKRWNFAEGVWMNGYWTHDWDNHSVRAASYGVENGTNDVIRLAANIPYGVMGGTWGRKERRFYVFNLLDELDAPGEWWLDRERKLLYLYPLNGAPTAADETTLAFCSAPILKAEKVQFVRFERLAFEYGYSGGISAGGSDLAFVDCRIANVCGSGMGVWGERNLVRGCEVCNAGSCGISVGGGDRKRLVKCETLVENCHVHDWALYQRTYAPGIGVNGCGVTLRRNRMHDAPHSAVLYGGNEHLFEYNEVYRVLMETGDAGAYYTGRDWTTMGNVLRYNYTHDLGAEGEHANTMGFYFDDCDCGDAVYGNVFHNVARGIMVGGGREHPIRNNIFSKCLIGLSIDCRGMTWKHWNSKEFGGDSWLLEEKAKRLDYTNGVWAAKYPLLAKIMQDHPREPLYDPVENNIFIDCRKELLALDGKASECLERMAPIAGNLVINSVGTNGVRTAKPDKRIAAGFRIVEGTPEKPFDAGFVDAEHGNFALRPDAWLLREMPAFKPLPPMTGIRSGDTVVFCGDSITCLANCNHYGYRHQLTNALAQVRGCRDVKAVNLGFCGNGVENWIGIERNSRTCRIQANDHSRAYPEESVSETFSNRVDVLVLSLGMNDMLSPFLGDGEADAVKWLDNYRTLIRNLRARVNPRRFAVTSIQPLTNDPESAKNRVEARLNAGIRKLADEEQVTFVDYHAALLRALGAIRRRSTSYQDTPDFVHPRELGNIAMAAELARSLGDADLANFLDARFAARLSAIVPAEKSGVAYRVFPRATGDVTSKERTYEVEWVEVVGGACGRETVRLVPDQAVNVVKVHGADVRIPAPWRVSAPMKKGATLAEVKEWKIYAPTFDYVGHDDPQSIDYMQAWFGSTDDTFFATRRIWSSKRRSLPFRFKTSAFSNTYEFTTWLNGKEIWRTKLPRGTQKTVDSSVLELQEGWNELVIRNDHASWQRQFAVEYLPTAGDDLSDLRYDATVGR